MKDEPLINYRDYIKSPYWEERKQKYYAKHDKRCAVCDHPDVDLHHIKYGHYGSEPDSALVPLCRAHHAELHGVIGVRKDTRYQSRYFIEEAREKWFARFSTPDTMPVSTPPFAEHNTFAEIIERIAAPIWRMLGK